MEIYYKMLFLIEDKFNNMFLLDPKEEIWEKGFHRS